MLIEVSNSRRDSAAADAASNSIRHQDVRILKHLKSYELRITSYELDILVTKNELRVNSNIDFKARKTLFYSRLRFNKFPKGSNSELRSIKSD